MLFRGPVCPGCPCLFLSESSHESRLWSAELKNNPSNKLAPRGTKGIEMASRVEESEEIRKQQGWSHPQRTAGRAKTQVAFGVRAQPLFKHRSVPTYSGSIMLEQKRQRPHTDMTAVGHQQEVAICAIGRRAEIGSSPLFPDPSPRKSFLE